MKILTADQIRNVDTLTMKQEPIESIDLMERASRKCVDWLMEHFGTNQSYKIIAGPGNNGGDGLAIARMLADCQNKVDVYLVSPIEKLSPEAHLNFKRLEHEKRAFISFPDEKKPLPDIKDTDIVIDALFGYGLSRPLTGIAATLVRHINRSEGTVVAIDVPSGLFPERNSLVDSEDIVHADFTLSFQFPKLAFFFAENELFTGKWQLLDIGLFQDAIDRQETPYAFVQAPDILSFQKKRRTFSHKGTFGHALLFAGSYGKMGASVLASRSCLKSGVGLLTVHTVSKGYEIMQIAVPEAMVSVDPSSDYAATLPELDRFSAIGIGPGIGTNDYTGLLVLQIIKNAKVPLVIDADGLNLLARNPEWLKILPFDTILTPHPGEFDRLAGPSSGGFDRHLKQIGFSRKYQVTVILKGAFTSITTPQGMCWFNSTGNPGMATAGSGDVLTGIVLSLLAQGYKPFQAALTAVFLNGLAGDLAKNDTGEEALTASDIINYISKAFLRLKSKL
jgi:NAD(P)H-hydrate epimerase